MPWDSTPWTPGVNGARVSPETARLLANMAVQGGEGVGGPDDCKVIPFAGGVHVVPGAAAVLNTNAGATGRQSYVGRLPTNDLVTVPSASTGARSDAIIVSIEDPQYGNFPAPTDPVTHQYIYSRRIANVNPALEDASELGLNYPALLLARIDMTNGASSVTTGMIKDKRVLAQPQRGEEQIVSTGLASGTQDLTASSFARWITPVSYQLRVPKWATHFIARLDVTNSIFNTTPGANGFGVLGLYYNGALVASNPYAVLQAAATTQRVSVQSAITNGVVAIPAGHGGTLKTFDLYGRRDSGTSSGFLSADPQTRGILNVTWLQRPR